MPDMNLKRDNPIGIFDSGIGGLTVAHAITKILPLESMIYFGDTAHLPYGDKSEAAIQAYSVKIADLLLKRGCKVIVIACNSASSAAYELLKEYVQNEAMVINVIDPMIGFVLENLQNRTVGLIGTKRTVQSGIYKRKIEEADPSIIVRTHATPLLAPMIEEGFFNDKISSEIIGEYLSSEALTGIEALILACTHYPLIKKEINGYYKNQIPILDSAEVVARALNTYLSERNLRRIAGEPRHEFLVSDYTESFEAATRIFFQKPVPLQTHLLWE
jgi:glutamate racemase